MPVVDLEAVKSRLFADQKVRAKLCKDFRLNESPANSSDLARALIGSIGQASATESTQYRSGSQKFVFRAAALALASNSRSWSTFLLGEPAFRVVLCDYDAVALTNDSQFRESAAARIAQCLSGQTRARDATAITSWAAIVSQDAELYSKLAALRREVRGRGATDAESLPVVAGILGCANNHARIAVPPPTGSPNWKLPGMGAVLASEFLRNLAWSGFKPDRHIKRLFGLWFPDVLETCKQRATALTELVGSRSKDLYEHMLFSLVGIQVTPRHHEFTEVDNLVWALGAYVERKGKESEIRYRLG